MTIAELIKELNQYPQELKVFCIDDKKKHVEIDGENIVVYSDSAFIDSDVTEDEWDTEDGKLELGDGEKYLILNAPVY